MAIDDRDINAVDAFLLDSLTEDERVYFESRLTNNAFNEYLQDQTLLTEVINEKGRYKMKQELQVLEDSYLVDDESKVVKTIVIPFYKRKRVLVAAASVILLVSFIGLCNIFNDSNSEELFASAYSPYPNLIDPITKGETTVYSPYQVYESGDYKGATIALLDASESDDRNWYLAQSYMALGEDQEAEALLESIIASPTSQYSQPAQWYTALMLLRQEDIGGAQTILNSIVKAADHPYAARAADLLREIYTLQK